MWDDLLSEPDQRAFGTTEPRPTRSHARRGEAAWERVGGVEGSRGGWGMWRTEQGRAQLKPSHLGGHAATQTQVHQIF